MYDGRLPDEGSGPSDRRPLVSIREIAKRLGLSHCAVSMALRGSPRISTATRQRVKDAADRMGYRPDPIFTALARAGITNGARPLADRLAWLAPRGKSHSHDLLQSHQAARHEALRHGYELVDVTPGGKCPPADTHQRLSQDGICGILLAWDHLPDAWLRFPWQHYSVVKVGAPGNSHFHGVAPNDVENTLLAYQHIRHRGYRRIGMISLKPDKGFPSPCSTAGFLAAQADLPEADQIPPHAASAPGTGKLREWFTRHQPDAVIADSAGVIGLLSLIGVRTPDDIGLALTHVPPGADLAGIRAHADVIGQDAVKLLKFMIHERRIGCPASIQRHLVNGHWQDGITLPVRQQRPAGAPAGNRTQI